MVNSRAYIVPASNTYETRLRCRLYSVSKGRPIPTNVSVRNNRHLQYPFVESIMGYPKVQPYIHNRSIIVKDGDDLYRFVVFFKRHCRLPLNDAISGNKNQLRGDVVVLRASVLVRPKYMGWWYVNMRTRDGAIVDFAMEQYCQELAKGNRSQGVLILEKPPQEHVRRSRRFQ